MNDEHVLDDFALSCLILPACIFPMSRGVFFYSTCPYSFIDLALQFFFQLAPDTILMHAIYYFYPISCRHDQVPGLPVLPTWGAATAQPRGGHRSHGWGPWFLEGCCQVVFPRRRIKLG